MYRQFRLLIALHELGY